MREKRQLDFITAIHDRIVRECLKNEKKTGFLLLCADVNFSLVENSLVFMEGAFNTKDYIQFTFKNVVSPERVKEAVYIYYSILWLDNQTKWNVKELILLPK